MNKLEGDILELISDAGYVTQRHIAEQTGWSLGKINTAMKAMKQKGLLSETGHLTEKTLSELEACRPRNAVILAAGFGLRMVPLNLEKPKGLLAVKGEPLIERLIRQLQEARVTDITVIVGFMKEQYEYLIDKHQVKLIYNRDYALKNNLHSLKLAAGGLSNTYIVPCDLWFKTNPFLGKESYSWYAVSALPGKESQVRVNRKMELVQPGKGKAGNGMIGLAYILKKEAVVIREKLDLLCSKKRYEESFWEETLFDGRRKMTVHPKVFKPDEVFEINTYEELRLLDEESAYSSSSVVLLIAGEMGVPAKEIKDIRVLKKGMTNRSFRFSCKDKTYIMRIPGEGTEELVSRCHEYDVYQALENQELSDTVVYMSSESGYKITEFLDDARACDPLDREDVTDCIALLKKFHQRKIEVGHSFDLFEWIERYESLWEGRPSIFADYQETKKNVMSLKLVIESMPMDWVLTHIDANPDNFLISRQDIRLIDWEYAGMQDPHVDIAMFAIYAMYEKQQVDDLIDLYFEGRCPNQVRLKIYAYVAVCGLLWSNWCEYKRLCGIEFGEYSLKQYRYGKDYYRLAAEAGFLSVQGESRTKPAERPRSGIGSEEGGLEQGQRPLR